MKSFKALLGTFVALALAFSFTSCSDVDSGSGGGDSALSYDYVTRNRGFIGGSVIYNPDGTNNQIELGTKIGLRLGYLKHTHDSVTQLEGVDFDSGSTINIAIDSNNSQTITGGSVTPKSVVQKTYSDIPERARYGFLDITAVDADKISFSVTLFSKDGSSRTVTSKTIALGGNCDLNGDDHEDLRYTLPPIKRTGHDNARWLTFVCDEETAHTTMYYTFSNAEKQSGYRAVGGNIDSSNAPDEGFYGVNTDGRFVYLHNDITQHRGSVFGDFVVDIDETATDFKEELDNVEARKAYSSPEEASQAEAQKSEAKIGSNCYTVVGDVATNPEEFNNYNYAYEYTKAQFPDPEKGPKDLLDKLVATKSVMIEDTEYSVAKEINALAELNDLQTLPTESDAVISFLVKILGYFPAIKAIAYSNGLKENFDAMINENPNMISDGPKYARRIIDRCYTQSPNADIKSPDISNIYPFMFVNVGSMYEGDYTSARSAYYDVGSSRSVCDSYGEFKNKRETINKKWSEFHAFKITKATVDEDGTKKTLDFEKDLGLTLAGGVKGGASCSSSKTQIDLGGAIYISLDASGEQVINNFIKYLTSGLNLGVPDTQIQIGPVPIVYGCNVIIGFTFEAQFNPHLCFIGMYGGEASFGATYGINWKWGFIPIPYFDTFGNTNKICETEAYIGFDDTKSGEFKWGPWVKVSPNVGLGWSAISVRASVPITTSFTMTNTFPPLAIKEADLGLKVQFVPYFELTVLSIIHIKKDFGTWDIVNGTLQLYPTPVHWK